MNFMDFAYRRNTVQIFCFVFLISLHVAQALTRDSPSLASLSVGTVSFPAISQHSLLYRTSACKDPIRGDLQNHSHSVGFLFFKQCPLKSEEVYYFMKLQFTGLCLSQVTGALHPSPLSLSIWN